MEKVFSCQRKYFLILVYTAWLCLIPLVQAESLHTISTPKELISYLISQIEEKTLLVLDIDDTLLVSEEPILRAYLLDHLLHEVESCFQLDLQAALNFIEFCLEPTPYRLGRGLLTSSEWLSVIQKFFTCSSKVIALTKALPGQNDIDLPTLNIHYSQQKTKEDRRFEDLQQVGLNFEESFCQELGLDAVVLSQYHFTNTCLPAPLFKKGILLTSLHPKGEVLSAFVQMLNWKPNKIIFIDNILENVLSIQEQMKELAISFQGVHFTYVENYLCKLDRSELQNQVNFILSNRKWPDGSH